MYERPFNNPIKNSIFDSQQLLNNNFSNNEYQLNEIIFKRVTYNFTKKK
jgi:hypothetical protein